VTALGDPSAGASRLLVTFLGDRHVSSVPVDVCVSKEQELHCMGADVVSSAVGWPG
jgi:hypothetical protein